MALIRCFNHLKALIQKTKIKMENLKLTQGLMELNAKELKSISGGDGFFLSLGRVAQRTYCNLRDWVRDYEGDPYIRLKMAGL